MSDGITKAVREIGTTLGWPNLCLATYPTAYEQVRATLTKLVNDAVKAEREACATVCVGRSERYADNFLEQRWIAAGECAYAIRARSSADAGKGAP